MYTYGMYTYGMYTYGMYTYILLTIASFRIGVPSILFFLITTLSYSNNLLRLIRSTLIRKIYENFYFFHLTALDYKPQRNMR
jgi:hypothetical protein